MVHSPSNIPEISVLMSTYKENPQHVSEAIESILNQTFQDLELIIINDLPTDEELDRLITSYTDCRVRYFRNKSNVGLAESMNLAESLARAGVIVRMDADDVALPYRLEKQLEVLETENCDLVCGKYSTINEIGDFITPEIGYNFVKGANISKNVQINPAIIHHPTVMFRKYYFDKVGGYRNFPCAQDLDLWMRMAEAGCRICYLPEIVLKYRLTSNSITQKKHFQQQLTVHYSYLLSLERIRKGYDSYSNDSYHKYLVKYGLGNPTKENRYERLYNLLRTHNSSNNALGVMKRTVNRLIVFVSYPSLRNFYLVKLCKKALLKYKK